MSQVVKDVHFAPRRLYEEFYCARGDMENRIKEQQLELFADRSNTHVKGSNQLRLWYSSFTHLIFSRLQAEVLKGTQWARASLGQIRLKLFKIAARVRDTVSAEAIRSLDHFIHNIESDVHDKKSFISYTCLNLQPKTNEHT